ncbi:MAG TPA: efflux RND transporter periplasmic adaptor subunit [Candidatus Paceibacterota bacterium]|jgi:multidrug resistance efflux pump|nr:efflux RND transporter periplasmic adaptor subunit [Candidatus Paceibacterota bacterium]
MENNNAKQNIFKKPWVHSLISFVIIFGLLALFLFWQAGQGSVLIENSNLEAPIISLAPSTPGTLNALYVKEGDRVPANAQVALVGSQIIYAKDGGIVSSAPASLGSYFAPGQSVVSVVNDAEMKVVGQIEETKGLKNLKTGQRATFTVDAFPGKRYEGVVDQIGVVSDDNGIVFSISDKRPIKKFDIKVRFNVVSYPELKSGMSAKVTVYTK